jgi:hypothetical protein
MRKPAFRELSLNALISASPDIDVVYIYVNCFRCVGITQVLEDEIHLIFDGVDEMARPYTARQA